MHIRRLFGFGFLGAALLAVTLIPAALSTTPEGFSASTLGRGTAHDKIKTRGNQPFDVVVVEITQQPGGHSGWHSHPGQAIVVVKSGTFTTYSADDKSCSPTHYEAGSVYVDPGYGHVHIARNEGSTPLLLHVTFLDVPVGGASRIDHPDPGNCPF